MGCKGKGVKELTVGYRAADYTVFFRQTGLGFRLRVWGYRKDLP